MPTITLKFKILSSETEFKTERAAGSNNYPEYQKTTKEAEQLLSEVDLDLDPSSEAEICQVYLNAPKYYHVLTEVLEYLRSTLKYASNLSEDEAKAYDKIRMMIYEEASEAGITNL